MTLTYKPDLDILPLDIHAKIQVLMSVRSAARVRRTHRQTDRQTGNVKTIAPDASETLGVIRCIIHLLIYAMFISLQTLPLLLLLYFMTCECCLVGELWFFVPLLQLLFQPTFDNPSFCLSILLSVYLYRCPW